MRFRSGERVTRHGTGPPPPMRLFPRISMAFLAMLVLSLGTALAFFLWFVDQSNERLIAAATRRLEFDVTLRAAQTEDRLDVARNYVRFVSGTPPIQGIIRARANGGVDPLDGSTEERWKDRLATIAQQMLRTEPMLLQVRYVGRADGGREIVRVERDRATGRPVRIEGGDLQRKEHEPYFTATLARPPGRMFVSRLNLNREHEEIQEPHQPVIRVATAVPSETGSESFGMVIVNIDATRMLDELQTTDRDGPRYYVVDEQGNFLLHPVANRCFEFEFGAAPAARSEIPQVALVFDAQATSLAIQDPVAGQAICARVIDLGEGADHGNLILIATDSLELVTSANDRSRIVVGLLCLAVAILALLPGLWLLRLATRPLIALTRSARKIDLDRPEFAIPEGISGEARELAELLNRTIHRIHVQTASLRRSHREAVQFAYITAHDLQEPIRAIHSFTHLLRQDYAERLDGEAENYLARLTRAAERMKDVMDGLLEYNRLGQESARTSVDLAALARDVAEDLADALTAAEGTVEVAALPTRSVYANEMRLLFLHLMGNAMKFRHRDRPLRIVIDAVGTGDELVLRVTDNGPGIPAPARQKVFQIYQRMHRRGDMEGTGVGLAHCRKIVDLHGGEIWIEDASGGGARFCFTLPAAPDATDHSVG